METFPNGPVFVPRWDGVNLWIDWPGRGSTGTEAAAVILRRPETGEQFETEMPLPCQLPAVFPQLQVQVRWPGESDFTAAVPADFDPNMGALFEFESDGGGLLEAGTCFAAIRDYRALVYRLGAPLFLEKGEPVAAWAAANRVDGYHRLHGPGEFRCRDRGFSVVNLTPTQNHYRVRPCGGEVGIMEALEYENPMVIALGQTL